MKKIIILILIFLSLGAQKSEADSGVSTFYQEAKIVRIEDRSNIMQNIAGLSQQKITLERTSNGKTQTIVIENSQLPKSLAEQLKPGDHVFIAQSKDAQGNSMTYITDYKRINKLAILGLLFLCVVIGVGRWQGFSSFVAMIVSFFAIVKIVIPLILNHVDPVISALLGGVVIVPVSFLLSHGISKKTTIGIAGTVVSLALTGILSIIFVDMTRITGFASEDANFVQLFTQGSVDIRSLFLGGIIIGAMGILDDITISQASIVERLKNANASYSFKKLYNESMIVGRDHIASLVNTLVLVYAGAALPLFVLFVNQNLSLLPVLNHELVATEIVRTVISSIGIVLAVPITTFFACAVYTKDTKAFQRNRR